MASSGRSRSKDLPWTLNYAIEHGDAMRCLLAIASLSADTWSDAWHNVTQIMLQTLKPSPHVLLRAVRSNNSALVQLLIAHKANVHVPGLVHAAVCCATGCATDVRTTRLLLEAGAARDAPCASTSDTPLMLAVRLQSLELVQLLWTPDSLLTENSDCMTAVLMAQLPVLQWFHSRVDLHSHRNSLGMSVLDARQQQSDWQGVKWCIEVLGLDPTSQPALGHAVSCVCLRTNNLELLQSAIQWQRRQGSKAGRFVGCCGLAQVVLSAQALVLLAPHLVMSRNVRMELLARPDLRRVLLDQGLLAFPLHDAVLGDCDDLLQWILEEKNSSALVNTRNEADQTPLDLAVQRSSARVVQQLVRAGAQLSAKLPSHTPLVLDQLQTWLADTWLRQVPLPHGLNTLVITYVAPSIFLCRDVVNELD
jgi:hypothetical protein